VCLGLVVWNKSVFQLLLRAAAACVPFALWCYYTVDLIPFRMSLIVS